MELNKYDILEKLEELEQDAWEQGFRGSGERELYLRESIANYILGLLKDKEND